jgi:hypothetical protein
MASTQHSARGNNHYPGDLSVCTPSIRGWNRISSIRWFVPLVEVSRTGRTDGYTAHQELCLRTAVDTLWHSRYQVITRNNVGLQVVVLRNRGFEGDNRY